MNKGFFVVRALTLIIVLFTFINAIAFVAIGIHSSISGIIGIVNGEMHTEAHPGILILESLDVFLVALVFIIFAIGIAKLFDPKSHEKFKDKIPAWLNISDFSGLKMILWETILTTLIVLFVSDVVKSEGDLNWQMLIIPGAILLLAVSMVLIKRAEKKQ